MLIEKELRNDNFKQDLIVSVTVIWKTKVIYHKNCIDVQTILLRLSLILNGDHSGAFLISVMRMSLV